MWFKPNSLYRLVSIKPVSNQENSDLKKKKKKNTLTHSRLLSENYKWKEIVNSLYLDFDVILYTSNIFLQTSVEITDKKRVSMEKYIRNCHFFLV